MGGKGKLEDSSLSVIKGNSTEEPTISTSKRTIIKNLLIVCFGFVLLFIAYNGLSMLQSTLNQQQGIGVASQSIIYAAFCVSTLLLPKYTIKKLGCKRTLLLSMSLYIPYIAANFYFHWFTMVPSAILVGLAASLLWSSQCSYFNESSVIYSNLCLREIRQKREIQKGNHHVSYSEKFKTKDIDLTRDNFRKLETLNAKFLQNEEDITTNSVCAMWLKEDSIKECDENNKGEQHRDTIQCSIIDVNSKDSSLQESRTNFKTISDSEEYSLLVSSVTARFFGLFGLIFRSSDIWGNLISYCILNDNTILDNISESGNCSCGAAFCNVKSDCFSHNLAEPTQQMRNILSGVSVLLACISVLLIFIFLDELETQKEPVKFSFSLAMATCKFARKKESLLLLPLSSYIGFQQGFYISDFTKSYIACAWGVYHVGLVTICYGIVAGIAATLAGLLVKYIGRIPVMIIGAVINATVCIFLLIWNPVPDQPLNLFISAALWGATVGILWSQLRAFYGVIFKKDEEAAFAGFYLWDSIGYCAAFSYSSYICTNIKIYILLSVSTVGMLGYLKTESIYMQRIKNQNSTDDQEK